MSYEGFNEFLCFNGHYLDTDCYGRDPVKCHCGEPIAWSHGVDQTNGYDEREPNSCCAPKVEVGVDDDWRIDRHGNRYAVEVKRYEPGPGNVWSARNRP